MCQVSMVYDHFRSKFDPPPPYVFPWQPFPTVPYDELRKLIAEFREAVILAKRLDVLMNQPDCEDLEKKRLEDRVAVLEKRLNELLPGPKLQDK